MSALLQQSEEWHQLRKNKIGASDAPVIMDVSPYKTPYQLWEEKVGLRGDQTQTEAMKRGLRLEATARLKFEEVTGIFTLPLVVIHPLKKWMMASLDGIDLEQKNILEIKCANKDDHAYAAKNKKVPKKYYPQLQHQMEVTGLNMAYYYSFDGENGVIVEVERDDAFIKEMVEKEEAFYHCIQDFTPPKMGDRDYELRDDDIWATCAEEWKQVQADLSALYKKEQELKDSFCTMARGKNCQGGGVRVSKIIRKGNIDYANIREIQGLDLEPYRKKASEYWKITA